MSLSVQAQAHTQAPLLYFEDLALNQPVRFGAIQITPDEAAEFNRAFDPIALAAPEAGLSPWHLCAVMMRALCDDFLCQAACIASPGIDVKRFLTPAYPGDRLSLIREIVEARRSLSTPSVGRIKMRVDMCNQRDEPVFTSLVNVLFHCRTLGEAP